MNKEELLGLAQKVHGGRATKEEQVLLLKSLNVELEEILTALKNAKLNKKRYEPGKITPRERL